MPIVTVSLWEEALDQKIEPQLIGAVTDALVDVLGEQVRPFVTVLLTPVPQRRWGIAGLPASASVPD